MFVLLRIANSSAPCRLPEYWCADFVRWEWGAAGASNNGELNAAAGSFYVFGLNHGTLHSTPSLGDAVVFNYHGNGTADHVAVVTRVNPNGTAETVSGDWAGQSGSQAHFASTSHALVNAAFGSARYSYVPSMGMTISGYISPLHVGNRTVNASGCTTEEVSSAAHFGCACVDRCGNGGFCPGTGCNATETNNAGKFGCACVDGKAAGGFCPGSGCIARETEDAAKFGCACVDHKGDGSFCPDSGCTARETEDAAKYGCGCVDHNGAGGACPGTGCTAGETKACTAKRQACKPHKCE